MNRKIENDSNHSESVDSTKQMYYHNYSHPHPQYPHSLSEGPGGVGGGSASVLSQRNRQRPRRKHNSNHSSSFSSGASNGSRRSTSFSRQDSGLTDSSDHSGVSSISSYESNRSSRSQRNNSNFPKNRLIHNSNHSNRRNMYSRQDSEHSFSSASSTANSTFSSDAGSYSSGGSGQGGSGKFMHNYKKPVMPPKSQYVALDCEMVGTLTGKSACARVVLIDWKGRSIMDQYVKPAEPVTDYRTFISGITEDQLKDASPLEEVRPLVQNALAGKILIGHGLSNDLECLGVEHPWHMIRDTALYEPFMKMHYGQMNPRKLKELAQERLNREIQVLGKPHSPVEDALAALDLYKSHRPRWEACMTSQIKEGQRVLVEQQKQRQHYEQYFAGLPIMTFP